MSANIRSNITFTFEVVVEPTAEAIIAAYLLYAVPDLDPPSVANVLGDVLSHVNEFVIEMPWQVMHITLKDEDKNGTDRVLYDRREKAEIRPFMDADDA